MKKTVLWTLLFTSVWGWSQDLSKAALREAECKRASRWQQVMRNANTQNYDVTYHKLEFTINPAQNYITGKVTTSFKALSPMNTVVFDLANQLTVSSVKSGSTSLSFSQNTTNELTITLPSTVPTGSIATVTIQYAGVPPSQQQAFTQTTHNNTPVIWTLSEPFGARDWWPCKQDLNDKIDSIDIYITAPATYVAVANGIEPEAPVISSGKKTTHFRHQYPIPAYLVAIAVTNYSIFNQTAGISQSFPIINYIYPENLTTAQSQLADLPAVMDVFETLFEPYPFRNEKYGHAQFGWGGGMEHTTVSFMVGFDRQLMAHELAHQWFGDKVTCGSWKDIWLNEGFATYLASMIYEQLDGAAAFIQDKTQMITYITSQPSGAVYLTDAEATDVNRIFSSRLSYDKGAMVLEMLRYKLGDEMFFQGLKNYLADNQLAYQYASTPQLQAHLEAVYGQSLQEFFNDWVYHQGYPTYTATVHNQSPNTVRVSLSQTTSDTSVDFFEMPVPLRFYGANNQQFDARVEHTQNGQVFDIQVPFTVTSMTIDPDKHLITANNQVTLDQSQWAQSQWQVWPNPTSGWVQWAPAQVGDTSESFHVYNALGQLLSQGEGLQVDLSGWPAGAYLLTRTNSQGTQSIHVVKR